MRNQSAVSGVVLGLVLLCLGQEARSHPEDAVPWRDSDRTLVKICFDGLDDTAQKLLRAQSITTSSIGSASLDLIGTALATRPIYQGALDHPSRFRSVLVAFPGSRIWAKIDAPADLRKYIDVWRDVPISYCTTDDRANLKVLNGTPVEETECPNLGASVTMKVASDSEHRLTILQLKSQGPVTFNNLRSCRQFAYGPHK